MILIEKVPQKLNFWFQLIFFSLFSSEKGNDNDIIQNKFLFLCFFGISAVAFVNVNSFLSAAILLVYAVQIKLSSTEVPTPLKRKQKKKNEID